MFCFELATIKCRSSCEKKDTEAENDPMVVLHLKHIKRDLVDELPRYTTIRVASEALGSSQVRILTDWYEEAQLFVEYTQPSLQLLLEQPCTGRKLAPQLVR